MVREIELLLEVDYNGEAYFVSRLFCLCRISPWSPLVANDISFPFK
jgi:hypothetical protein